ncbi:MAG: DUF494 family protein [Bacteroidota bacterium]|nr:DUF494 family protein [Bacteroidota bacterium]
MLDNPYVMRNHRRFAVHGMNRLSRLGFSSTEVLQALFWLPHVRTHTLLFRRPPAQTASFRPFYGGETQLFSADGFHRLMQMYSLHLLSVHDLEQLLTHIQAEELPPVDTETLEELLYELFPTYSTQGMPFYTGLPSPERVQ